MKLDEKKIIDYLKNHVGENTTTYSLQRIPERLKVYLMAWKLMHPSERSPKATVLG